MKGPTRLRMADDCALTGRRKQGSSGSSGQQRRGSSSFLVAFSFPVRSAGKSGWNDASGTATDMQCGAVGWAGRQSRSRANIEYVTS